MLTPDQRDQLLRLTTHLVTVHTIGARIASPRTPQRLDELARAHTLIEQATTALLDAINALTVDRVDP